MKEAHTHMPPVQDEVTIDEALWEQLIALTDGEAALCYQCGVCTALCPWGLVREGSLSVRSFMRRAQLGLPSGCDDLWLCTTCAQCETGCPRGVHVADMFRALRSAAWEERQVATGLPSLMWSLYWNDNPWSQPPSQRSLWAADLNVPRFDPQQHEILLYIGCTSSYDRRAQKIGRTLVRVLRAAGVSFGTLGDEEPCCGEAALSVGHRPYFEEIAAHSAQVFQEHGVRRLAAISPHCYDVFKNHYSSFSADFQPLHYTHLLAELLQEGRLKFEQGLKAQVTFQDPCYLGRHNGEYEAPRQVLEAIPGLELIEMHASGEATLCCGGGGGRMWLETEAGERFSDLRVLQAKEIGASYLATACPFCIVCLEDSAKVLKLEDIQVMDISEIAALALGMQGVG
jgi:Fe-S oxidoreductase